MRKKKVLSFFTFLGLFAISLAALNVMNFGSLTGKVIAGDDYTEELFFGNNYEFKYYPSSFNALDGQFEVRGQLVELAEVNHELQVTTYVFGVDGNVIGTSSNELFLESNGNIALNVRTSANEKVNKIIMYIEDERSSVRVYKELGEVRSSLTGRVTAEIDKNGKTYGSFLAGFLIFASLVIFVVYRVSEYKKSVNLGQALNHKQGRHFIDLDVR